ncbi:MAG: helix-turn-helix transcriptional regulator [Vagococcus sp.]|uniref:helix-turn-helix domain-containing protein n=1 Tax=Vagococcus sp. TaxID=1933889 RepID=UPI002FC602F9
MILNKLSLLLAERQLKVTTVANATKISRTTLTALMKNESKMIQFDTINSLCLFLEVEPKDFFDFVPYNFSYHFDSEDELVYDPNTHPLTYKANGIINIIDPVDGDFLFEYNGLLTDFGGDISVYLEPAGELMAEVAESFFSGIPKSFITLIEKEFREHIEKSILEEGYNVFSCDVSLNLTSLRNKRAN